jgi:uncharacterized protein YjdB
MASQTQVNNFLNKIVPIVQKEYLRRERWVLPSVCIAQAALESAWGTSAMMTKANAYFGIKAGSNWKGKVYSSKTKECYAGIGFTTITGVFRAYDSLADSISDYYNLICNNSRYASAINNSNPRNTITAIKNAGYATDPNYISDVMAIINKYNLTKYDALVSIKYKGHCQTLGDTSVVKDGATCGTTGRALRLEALSIVGLDNLPGAGIAGQAHVQDIGWQNQVIFGNGNYIGTKGKALRMEAIKLSLFGANSNKYNIWYRVHMQSIGWGAWVKNGTVAGTVGQKRRIEAVQIIIQKR